MAQSENSRWRIAAWLALGAAAAVAVALQTKRYLEAAIADKRPASARQLRIDASDAVRVRAASSCMRRHARPAMAQSSKAGPTGASDFPMAACQRPRTMLPGIPGTMPTRCSLRSPSMDWFQASPRPQAM
ncbi:hypothetical protein GCM10009078_15750 [Cupriavidus gilardii]